MSDEIGLTDFSGMSHILRKSFLGHGGWLGSLILAVTHTTGVWEILLLPTIFILSWIVIRTSLPEISFLLGLSFDLAIPLQYTAEETRARYAPRLESYWRKFTIGTLVELAAYFFLFDDLVTLVFAFKTTIGLSLWIVDPTPLVAASDTSNAPSSSSNQTGTSGTSGSQAHPPTSRGPSFGKDAKIRGTPDYFDRKLYEGGYTDDAARDVLRKELMDEGKGLPMKDKIDKQMKKLDRWTGDTEENKKTRMEDRAARANPTRPTETGQASIPPNKTTPWPSVNPGTREYFDQKLRRGYFDSEGEIKKAIDKLMAIGDGKSPGDPEVLREQEKLLDKYLESAERRNLKIAAETPGPWEYILGKDSRGNAIGEKKLDEELEAKGYDDVLARQLLILELREDPDPYHARQSLSAWLKSSPEDIKKRMKKRVDDYKKRQSQGAGTEQAASRSAPPRQPPPPQQQNRPANNNPAPSSSLPSNMVLFGERSEILPENHYLSNWYLSDFTDPMLPNIVFKSVDHYVAYRKVCLFNDGSNSDMGILQQILRASTAEGARTLGSRIRGFVPGRSDRVWNASRSEIMERGMSAKFATNNLRGPLMATRGKILAAVLKKHGGGYDTELGIGEPGVFGGQNQMGVQLMRVRHRPPNAQWPGEIIFFHKEYPDPGHGYPDDGRHCFSNWYPNLPFSDPEIDANVNLKQRLGIDPNTSIVFGTSEHYMMFWKALIYRNPRLAAEIISPANRNHPNVAKDLAKAAAEAAPAHDNLWRRINKDVVRRGCYLKFTSQDTSEELDYLLGTGKARLAESAPNDEFWGLKYDITNALPNQSRWGKNQLGEVLEDVRTCINTGAGCPPITWSSHI